VNIVTVKINGMEYNIRGEENDAYLHMVASFVDKKISDLLESNSRIGRADATILAALNLGDEVFKKKELYERADENLKQTLKDQRDLMSQIGTMKNTIEELMKEYEECEAALKRKVQVLKEEKIKQVSLNKKLLSNNNDWRYKDIEKARKIENLTKELEKKNCELMRVNSKNNVLKKVKL